MEQDNPKKVLVIDDDPDVHRLMKWMLERHGFHVSTAADSQSGLNSVKTLALSFTLVSTVRNAGDEDYDPNVIFRRSLYAAVAARSIAQGKIGINNSNPKR